MQILTIEGISIISGIVSVILGFLAIGLSVYFFIQAKKAESETSNSLESIKAQTDILQKITARQLDRLTKYATETGSYSDFVLQVFSLVKEFPTNISGNVSNPVDIAQKAQLLTECIRGYIGIFYYSALTNIALQWYLPPIEKYDENREINEMTKQLVNNSYSDFNIFGDMLKNQVHASNLTGNPVYNYYLEAQNNLRPYVKDTTQIYADRESKG